VRDYSANGYLGSFMSTQTDLGRVAPRAAPACRRSGPPASGPQREALRSGKWVTQPVREGGPR